VSKGRLEDKPLSRARVSTIMRGTDITDVLFPVTRHRLEDYRLAAERTGMHGATCRSRYEHATTRRRLRRSQPLLTPVEPPDPTAAMSDEQSVRSRGAGHEPSSTQTHGRSSAEAAHTNTRAQRT
jgi:hypothetical protein